MINRRRLLCGAVGFVAIAKPSIVRAQTITNRTYLNSNLNMYVAINGDDNNDGLSANTPLRHWQTAWNRAATLYDTGGFNIVLNIADSLNWQENFTATYPLIGGGPFTLRGSAQSAIGAFACKNTVAGGITALNGARLYVFGMALVCTAHFGQCLRATKGGYIGHGYNSYFCDGYQGYCDQQGAMLEQLNDVGIAHTQPLAYTCAGHIAEARMTSGVCVALQSVSWQEACLIAIANGNQTITGTAGFDTLGHAVSGYRVEIMNGRGGGLHSSIPVSSIMGSVDYNTTAPGYPAVVAPPQ